eukprot:3291942-Amphidinium_carterae.1
MADVNLLLQNSATCARDQVHGLAWFTPLVTSIALGKPNISKMCAFKPHNAVAFTVEVHICVQLP